MLMVVAFIAYLFQELTSVTNLYTNIHSIFFKIAPITLTTKYGSTNQENLSFHELSRTRKRYRSTCVQFFVKIKRTFSAGKILNLFCPLIPNYFKLNGLMLVSFSIYTLIYPYAFINGSL